MTYFMAFILMFTYDRSSNTFEDQVAAPSQQIMLFELECVGTSSFRSCSLMISVPFDLQYILIYIPVYMMILDKMILV